MCINRKQSTRYVGSSVAFIFIFVSLCNNDLSIKISMECQQGIHKNSTMELQTTDLAVI